MRRPLFGLLALIAGVTAMAAGAAGETLEEAMVAAYTSNPTLLAQRAALRATDEGVAQALSGWRPTLSASAEIGKEDVESEGRFASGQTRDETLTPETYSLNLSQPLYRGGRTLAATAQAENLVRADRARLAEVEQDVLLQAATAYMDVLRDQAVLEFAINNEQRLRRQLEAARDRFDVGVVTRTDVAQAEARLSNSIADRVRARSNLTSSRASYLNVVGEMPGTLSPPPGIVGLPDTEREAHEIAAEENPTILRAVYAERAARQDVRGAVGGLLPEVSLDADLRRAEDQASRGSLRESASVSARVTIPLYQAGSVYSQVRAARQVAAQRRLEIDESRRAVFEEVTQVWQDLAAARAQITAFSDAVRAAEIALEGVEHEAAVGARTTLDVLDAEQELFDARVDLVRAQRDEVVAGITLRGTVGRLTAEALGLPVEIDDASHHYRSVRNKLFGFGTEIYRAQGRYAEAEPLDQRAPSRC